MDEFFDRTSLVATSATQNVGGNYADFYDSYVNAQGEDEFYNAIGDAIDRMRKRQKVRQKNRDERRKLRAKGKYAERKAGLEAAKSMTASAKSDAEIAKALKSDSPKKDNTMKIALIAGGVLVLGIVAFIAIKASKK